MALGRERFLLLAGSRNLHKYCCLFNELQYDTPVYMTVHAMLSRARS
jgi:hypothetical protein